MMDPATWDLPGESPDESPDESPEVCAVCGGDGVEDGECRLCGAQAGLEGLALASARRRNDLRALRSVHRWVDEAGVERLLDVPRGVGGLDRSVVRHEALKPSAAETCGAGERRPTFDGAVSMLVRHMVLGEFSCLQFVELAPHAVVCQRLELGRNGVPVMDTPQYLDYVEPSARTERVDLMLYRLAGGGASARHAGDVPTLRPFRELAASVDAVRHGGRGAADTEVVLVVREPGWPVLARLAEMIIERALPAVVVHDSSTTRVVTPDRLDQVVRNAPLRHGYHLAVAAVGRHGRLRPVTVELFGPGSVPGRGTGTVAVRVHVPEAVTAGVHLPIVRVPDEDRPETWESVSVHELPTARGVDVEVHVALATHDDPVVTEVRAVGPPTLGAGPPLSVRRVHDRDWQAVRAAMPATFVPAHPLDVAVLVELDGVAAADARGILAALLGRLDEVASAAPGLLRVAVVGYHDHARGRWATTVSGPLIEPLAFADPVVVAGRILSPGPVREAPDARCAAVEDALDFAADRLEWRPDVDRALLIIGSRPATPPRESGVRAGGVCPRRLDWRERFAAVGVDDPRRLAAAVRRPPWMRRDVGPGSPAEDASAFWQHVSGGQLTFVDGLEEPAEAADELADIATAGLRRSTTSIPVCLAQRPPATAPERG